MTRLLGSLLLLVLMSNTAQASDFYVDVTNNSANSIYYLYVSPDKSDSWEEDVLGNDTISSGSTTRVNLRGYKSPVFDIKAVDSEGEEYIFWEVDVSTDDIVIYPAKGTKKPEYYVDVTNSTRYTMYYLYVSPENSSSWEEDVLQSDVLSSGDTTRVTLTGYNSPIFDIKAVDNEGDEYIFWDVDVSSDDIVITLDALVR